MSVDRFHLTARRSGDTDITEYYDMGMGHFFHPRLLWKAICKREAVHRENRGHVMNKKSRLFLVLWLCTIVLLLAASILVPGQEHEETIREAMRDAVLHESNKINLPGFGPVNPGLISAVTVTGVLLVAALLIRIFVIPRFQYIPGTLQLLLEQAVGLFDNLAKANSPWRNGFLGAYLFGAGCYIFFGTLFELFGIQAITTSGASFTLPAPLADVNAAIMLGALSYFVICSGAIAGNGFHSVGSALKEISLLISMSFRLFGALLSGLLVTELVYYYITLSYVLPVVVAVMFTLLHALIQTYVLTMLTALFYGEMSEPKERRAKASHRRGAKPAKSN